MTERMPMIFSRQASHGEGKTPRSGRWRPDNGRRWMVVGGRNGTSTHGLYDDNGLYPMLYHDYSDYMII